MFPAVLATTFFYVNVPQVEMREQPTQKSEIASQAYFSEEVRLVEEQGEWQKIETVADSYPGWIKKGALIKRQDVYLQDPASTIAKVNRTRAHLYDRTDTTYGPLMTLPFDSRLKVVAELPDSNKRWIKVELPDQSQAFIQRGDVLLNPSLLPPDELVEFSKRFLGLPYTWGGRGPDYDCSGFMQMLLRQMGYRAPRDSKDQIKWDQFEEVSLDKLQPRDFVFFGPNKDKINHVGMYIGNGEFIHSIASVENMPYFRISKLTDQAWNGDSTNMHPYRAARRLKQPQK